MHEKEKIQQVNGKMLKYVIIAAALLMVLMVLMVLPVPVFAQIGSVDFAAKLSSYYVLNASDYTGYKYVPQYSSPSPYPNSYPNPYSNPSSSPYSNPYSGSYKCGKDQVISFGSRRLTTNLWGTPADENIQLNENCVFKNSVSFGWSWNRTDPVTLPGENNTAPNYPSVGTGTDPWGGFSTSKYLPVRIMDISSFTLDVRYSYSALPSSSDSVNLAYDIWITDTDKPNPDTPRREVMIWLNRINVPMPEDKRMEDVSDGYNTYRQYAYENYTAFIIDTPPSSGIKSHKANPKKLIDYLAAKGDLSGDLWVSKIDFGSEVWKSIGKIEILNLNIVMNNIII